ncbi:hypothetical protein ACJMK2_041236 [Sinanodonta woodiana]|uniref:HMG domain-containing protein n=1 Tax=Sinanodonta woodiana TaxID=1069815 RepID=A0ABD3W5B4_SINWO
MQCDGCGRGGGQIEHNVFHFVSLGTHDKRIRASDLMKKCCHAGEGKYDFSKIVALKGGSGRDVTKKGRPPGITSGMPSKTTVTPAVLRLPDSVPCESETVVDDSTTERVLTSEEIYGNLLKGSDGLFMIDETYQTFMIQDLNKDRVALKTGKFLFMCRRGVAFNEDVHWLYKCTCDVPRSELIECCGDRMHVSYSDFMRRVPGCIHISTLSIVLDHFDAVNQIFPTLKTEVRKGLFCVMTENGHGVIDISKEPKCLTCGSTLKVKCIHLQKFSSHHEELCQTSGSTHLSYEPKCLSEKKIPFNSSIIMQAVYLKPFTERFIYDGEYIILVPDYQLCDVCDGILQESSSFTQANIFGVHQIVSAKIFSKRCMECEKTFHVDGLEQCVLYMGRIIMCHEVLRRFMYYFLTGKTTIFTEYTVLCRMHIDAGHDIQGKLSYSDFKSAWYSFLDLLEIDYTSSFVCSHCGLDPDTVVMDATSLSFRKDLVSWQNILSLRNTFLHKPYDAGDEHRVKERTLFSRTVRCLLLDFTSRGISLEQKGKLLHTVQEENQSSELLSLLTAIVEDCMTKGDRIVAKVYWRELIKALASSNPFCSFLFPSEDLFDFLNCSLAKHIAIFKDDTTHSRIQKEVPIFFNLLSSLKEKFPFDTLKDSLPYFKQKVFDPFIKKTCPSELPNEEDIDDLAFFPQLPQIRKRGTFVADKKGLTLKDICAKFSKGHPHLLPGVFTLFCPHGICYGFQVMKVHESPDVPFTLLRTRFRKAPKLVVYDNACSLHVYSLNRDPVFFKDTSFRVDSLHFRNHTACGPSYELKAYPQFSKLNSQVVEQSNSRLQRLKGSLSYMTQNNFMKHCKFYLWGQNQDVLSKNK